MCEYSKFLSEFASAPAPVSEAAPSQVLTNAMKDPNYAPYCMRCSGAYRMQRIEPFLWSHHCGAIHDERQNAKRFAPDE
jgi:hypothetical protein